MGPGWEIRKGALAGPPADSKVREHFPAMWKKIVLGVLIALLGWVINGETRWTQGSEGNLFIVGG